MEKYNTTILLPLALEYLDTVLSGGGELEYFREQLADACRSITLDVHSFMTNMALEPEPGVREFLFDPNGTQLQEHIVAGFLADIIRTDAASSLLFHLGDMSFPLKKALRWLFDFHPSLAGHQPNFLRYVDQQLGNGAVPEQKPTLPAALL